MRQLVKIVGLIVIGLVAVLLVLSVTGFEPTGRVAGLWLKGDSVTTPVTDWSFTDKIPEIKLQTQTPVSAAPLGDDLVRRV